MLVNGTLRVAIKYVYRQPQYIMERCLYSLQNTIAKITINLYNLCLRQISLNKIWWTEIIVQLDSTMSNFKCKSHRCRFVKDKNGVFSMVELSNEIMLAYATIIPDKKS